MSAVFLILTGILLYIFKPKLFYLDKKRKLSYSLENDLSKETYEELLVKALNEEAYAEAIRLEYLNILGELHIKGLISYDSNKTVNEYIYELKDKNLYNLFRLLSIRFLYYRYGNGLADRKIYEQFREESKGILNRISSL